MSKYFKDKRRYLIFVVLCIIWFFCFMDRMVMSVAIPYIAKDFNLTPLEMGGVLSAFFGAYSISQLPGGYLADKFGPSKIAAIAIVWWSMFTAATGMVWNLTQMVIVRIIFGLGEGIFPGSSFKIMSAWFSRKEVSTVVGIRMSANQLGTAMTPMVVVAIMAALGWRWAFYILGLVGILLIVLWIVFIKDSPAMDKKMSAEELAVIQGDAVQQKADKQKIKLSVLLRNPVLWKFFIILFGVDMTLWGFSSWLPSYLVQAKGFSMVKMGMVATLPFAGGIVGCALGGWVSDKFFKDSRRVPLIASELLSALFLYLTLTAESPTMIVVWLCMAGIFINFSTTSFWSLPMAIVPTSVMGMSSSFINFAGQFAAFVTPMIMGYLVQYSGGGFTAAFMLLVGSSIFACLMTFTIKSKGLKFETPSQAMSSADKT